MKNFQVKILVFASILLLSTTRVVFADSSAEAIKIGSILILSGEGASWGTSAQKGMDLAIEKINAQGGVLGKKFVAIHQDDHADPKTTISAFKELTGLKDIRFIIGPSWSNLAIPLIDMADTSKTIVISPSVGVAKFTESSKYLFSTWPHDVQFSSDLADLVFSKGHKAIALVGAQQVWVREQTDAFKERFQKLGGKILYLTEPNPGTTDLKTEALKIINTPGIEAVVSTTDGIIVGSLVAKALKDLNAHFPLFSISLDQAAIDAAQGGFEGLEFVTGVTPTAAFKTEYEARYHTPPDAAADSAYDAIMMLAEAMRQSGSLNTEAVADKLSQIKVYDGASGKLTSDGKRGFTKPYALRKVVGGKPQDLVPKS